jgi:feruloyl esterase
VRRYLSSILFLFALPLAAQTTCERLAQAAIPNAVIALAAPVTAGDFKPEQSAGGPNSPTLHVPAFCRIAATLHPTSDSSIGIEVWLPEDWNGKFQAVGGGGWAGVISYPAMAAALAEGYATSSTDTGHKGSNAEFAPGHREKMIDYGYRAVHEMTVVAKLLITARYAGSPRLSYWNGCSTGGRQGLQEAQMYPADYDAILAGAPANYLLHLNAWDLQAALINQKDEVHLVPATKLAMLHRAVLEKCDGLDGVKDGLLNDPRACKFDPSALLCKGSETAACLTAAQLESVQAMYAPAKRKDGTLVYPGMPYGGEQLWTRLFAPSPFGIALSTYRYAVHESAAWDWHSFDLDADVALADRKLGYVHAINPDLTAFRDRGGKLLMYHGWADQLISAENSINYHAAVERKMGGNQDNWYRLFMVPGMGHCRGGDGPNQFNAMGALERWREASEAPVQILATHVTNNNVDVTRPLCPYPQVAVYKRVGSSNDATNFVCKSR